MIGKSDNLDQLAPALVAAAKALTNPAADKHASIPTKTGGKYEYEYASFPSILDLIRPLLAEHGLTVIQAPTNPAKGGVGISTMLLHSSGQWLETEYDMAIEGTGAQAVGSAISYGRRYCEMAMLNLASTEDDDGAAASQRPKTQRATRSAAGPGSKKSRDDAPPPPNDEHPHAEAAAAPTYDWNGMGWTDKAEHDTAIAGTSERITRGEAQHPGFREHMAGVWRSEGLKLPLSFDKVAAWHARIDAEAAVFERKAKVGARAQQPTSEVPA